MASVYRYRVEWVDGAVVGPGVSTFHWSFLPDIEDLQDVRAWFNAVKGFLPGNVTLVFPGSVEVLDVDTGALTGVELIGSSPAPVVGGGAGGYAAGVGARVVWYTDGIFRGRRVKGATYLVPITSAFYDSQGNISSANVDLLQTASSTLVSNTSLCVWSRPRKGQVGGAVSTVVGCQAKNSVTWLRSRRT